ncbi:PH domain-containing protein [Streptomyces sp. NPDC057620]|uniref:PH domain-containing protein n=1 Tax=Streptomyces liliiviolaceus TaxID=2823109 RepID=A0A940XUP5_9ACTN|nr:PH domain-containing protein [Streptomyces liliiviolaceus]MBQ0846870.1 PH domain-containing protein [Streptomyces liliiviolaceus]
MTTPDHQPPAPDTPSSPEPQFKDRVYRSPSGVAGGALLLAIAAWLGIDALVTGEGRTPWVALAALLLLVPLVAAFTLRPAVHANEQRLRIRNPFRVITLPWGTVEAFRSGYSNEVLDKAGTKYQVWAVPVSLRARNRAARKEARGGTAGARGRLGQPRQAPHPHPTPVATGPVRAQGDQIIDELRELVEAHAKDPQAQGEVSVRWAYEVLAPAAAGAVLLAILLSVA